MRHAQHITQTEAFTGDLTPHMEAARNMYPGGRFQRFLRGFDRIFHGRGFVEMVDTRNAMIVADREARAVVADAQAAVEAAAQGRTVMPVRPGARTMRETLLADTYGRQDRGELVHPGELAQREGWVQEERINRTAQTPVPQPQGEFILPPGGVIDADALPPMAGQLPQHDLPLQHQ